ncbi:MAG TPA: NAD(P)-dependent oxidoreductase [Candidatus Dormibacteraeota bacterium]|jgi:siroheme synthase-like protein|nr:NAD(P)-dependent oxidoreductase [Candidatus Dormibacteraeota bacterium]
MTGGAAGDGSRPAYYPVYLDLSGRPVAIIGGGAVAAAKVGALLEAGADLTVIAPGVEDSIRERADEGRLRWSARDLRRGDLHGVRLAIDATENGDGNRLVRDEADREGCLLNSVDRTALCDWIAPAVVDRGALKVAISTAGESPFLAGAIRRRLEVVLGEEWGPFVRLIGALRRRLRADGVGPREQEAIYRRALRSDARTLLRKGHEGDARSLLDRLPGEPRTGGITVVGAGPGLREHLTLAAVEVLQNADVVFGDPAVPRDLLSVVGPRTRLEEAGADVVDRLLSGAAEGVEAVWLRLGEGCVDGFDDLRHTGVRISLVPGVDLKG